MLIRIVAPHFVAGIIEGDAAPILRYMRGWTIKRIKSYCKKNGWSCEVYGVEGERA